MRGNIVLGDRKKNTFFCPTTGEGRSQSEIERRMTNHFFCPPPSTVRYIWTRDKTSPESRGNSKFPTSFFPLFTLAVTKKDFFVRIPLMRYQFNYLALQLLRRVPYKGRRWRGQIFVKENNITVFCFPANNERLKHRSKTITAMAIFA